MSVMSTFGKLLIILDYLLAQTQHELKRKYRILYKQLEKHSKISAEMTIDAKEYNIRITL